MSQNKGLSGSKSTLSAQQATTSLWGGNSSYVEDLYERYLAGEEIPADWRKYFSSLPGASADTPHGPLVQELTQRAQLPRTGPLVVVAELAKVEQQRDATSGRPVIEMETTR